MAARCRRPEWESRNPGGPSSTSDVLEGKESAEVMVVHRVARGALSLTASQRAAMSSRHQRGPAAR